MDVENFVYIPSLLLDSTGVSALYSCQPFSAAQQHHIHSLFSIQIPFLKDRGEITPYSWLYTFPPIAVYGPCTSIELLEFLSILNNISLTVQPACHLLESQSTTQNNAQLLKWPWGQVHSLRESRVSNGRR